MATRAGPQTASLPKVRLGPQAEELNVPLDVRVGDAYLTRKRADPKARPLASSLPRRC